MICTGATQVLSLIIIYSIKQYFTVNVVCQVPDYYPAFVSKDMTDISDGLSTSVPSGFPLEGDEQYQLCELTRTF